MHLASQTHNHATVTSTSWIFSLRILSHWSRSNHVYVTMVWPI